MKKRNESEEQMTIGGTEENEILARLSERVEKAVGMIQELRRERDVLKLQLADVEAQLREHAGVKERASALEEDRDRFARERTEIRDRIETILSSLESLDTAEATDEE